MAETTVTINAGLPHRRWARAYVVTLDDSAANLQLNGTSYYFLQNTGAGGLVNIIWVGGSTVDLYLSQGEVIEGGQWITAKSTGSTVGAAVLRGLL